MEILVAVVVVLAVAALLGRGQGRSTATHLAAQPPLSAPAPGPVVPARETPDEAFVLGYVIGRHIEHRRNPDAAERPVEDSCDDWDGAMCDDAYDDWDE